MADEAASRQVQAEGPANELDVVRESWKRGRTERQRRSLARGDDGTYSPLEALDRHTTRLDEAGYLVRLSGEVDAFNAPELSAELERLADTGASRIVVDLSAVTLIDSSGLGALLGAYLRFRSGGAKIVLVAGPPEAMRSFEVTGLDRLFTVAPSLSAAMATS